MRKPKERKVSDLSARVRRDEGDKGQVLLTLTLTPAPLVLVVLLLFCPCPRTANTSFSFSDHTATAPLLLLAPPSLALAPAPAAAVMFSQSLGAQKGVPLEKNTTWGRYQYEGNEVA